MKEMFYNFQYIFTNVKNVVEFNWETFVVLRVGWVSYFPCQKQKLLIFIKYD